MTKYKGVAGGTITGPPLCRTCSFASYIQGRSEGQTLLFCSAIHDGRPMPFEAYECSAYEDKRLPTRNAMEKTAWILRTDEFRKTIGFVSPGEWRAMRLERRKAGDYDDD